MELFGTVLGAVEAVEGVLEVGVEGGLAWRGEKCKGLEMVRRWIMKKN